MNLCRPMEDPRPCTEKVLEVIRECPGIGRHTIEMRVVRGNTKWALEKLLRQDRIYTVKGRNHVEYYLK